MELTVQGLGLVKALADARVAEKAAQKAAKEAAEAVKALLGTETQGTVAGITMVEIKTVGRTDVDRKALEEKYPEIYAEVLRSSTYEKIVLA